MSLNDDMRVLADVSLFQGFTSEQLRLMAFGAENLSLKAGRILYAMDTPADCAFILSSGTIELFREDDGERTILQELVPHAILGELALIGENERLTSACAKTDCELIRLNRSMFRRILQEYPDTAMLLHDRISRNLQAMIRRLEGVAARLAEKD